MAINPARSVDVNSDPLLVVVGVAHITVTFGDGSTREVAVKNRYALFHDKLTYSVGDLSTGIWSMVSSQDIDTDASYERMQILLETAGTTLEEIRRKSGISSSE